MESAIDVARACTFAIMQVHTCVASRICSNVSLVHELSRRHHEHCEGGKAADEAQSRHRAAKSLAWHRNNRFGTHAQASWTQLAAQGAVIEVCQNLPGTLLATSCQDEGACYIQVGAACRTCG